MNILMVRNENLKCRAFLFPCIIYNVDVADVTRYVQISSTAISWSNVAHGQVQVHPVDHQWLTPYALCIIVAVVTGASTASLWLWAPESHMAFPMHPSFTVIDDLTHKWLPLRCSDLDCQHCDQYWSILSSGYLSILHSLFYLFL